MIAKKDEEMTALREGGKRLGEILRTLVALVAPGISTQALEDEARRLVARPGNVTEFLVCYATNVASHPPFIGVRPENPVEEGSRPTGMNGRKLDCARGGVRYFQQKSPGAAPRIPRGVLYSGPTG